MPITIKGIRITSFSVSVDNEGKERINASYQLISSADKVLAKETVDTERGYGDKEAFVPSPPVKKAIADAIQQYKAEIAMNLGLDPI
jgi:hypothetical protein